MISTSAVRAVRSAEPADSCGLCGVRIGRRWSAPATSRPALVVPYLTLRQARSSRSPEPADFHRKSVVGGQGPQERLSGSDGLCTAQIVDSWRARSPEPADSCGALRRPNRPSVVRARSSANRQPRHWPSGRDPVRLGRRYSISVRAFRACATCPAGRPSRMSRRVKLEEINVPTRPSPDGQIGVGLEC